MFETILKTRLKRIFDLDKVSFDRPSESQEQEACFIAVASAKCRIVDKRQLARVTGKLQIFASLDKMPYGYLTKAIAGADEADTKDLFFFDFEENKGTFRNITERSIGFVFLFDGQFDPALGRIDEIDLSIAES